jgi:hypothetical protein
LLACLLFVAGVALAIAAGIAEGGTPRPRTRP